MKSRYGAYFWLLCMLTTPLLSMKEDLYEKKKSSPKSALEVASWLALEAKKVGFTAEKREGGGFLIGSISKHLEDGLVKQFTNVMGQAAWDLKHKEGRRILVSESGFGDRLEIEWRYSYNSNMTPIHQPSEIMYTTSQNALLVSKAASLIIARNSCPLLIALMVLNQNGDSEWLSEEPKMYPFFGKSAVQVAQESHGEKALMMVELLKKVQDLASICGAAKMNPHSLFAQELEKLCAPPTCSKTCTIL